MTPVRMGRIAAALFACAALGLGACADSASGPRAEFVSRLDWPAETPLGGFSGIEVEPDGSAFFALSDRSGLIAGHLIRQGDRLTSIVQQPPRPLHGPDGAPLRDMQADSEGLARGPDGRLYVSFEGNHRVAAYDRTEIAIALPRPRAFDDLQGNSGFEALAVDAEGRLYTLPERSGQLSRPFPVWRFAEGRWTQPFSLPRRGGHLPVGADFGPDGRMYLLEREFTGVAFRSRVRRFTIDGDRVLDEETLLSTLSHRHGNLEGIAVWRDARGSIRLTMVSDDNFNRFQRSEIVEYRVTE